MKNLFFLVLFVSASACYGASPAFTDFNTHQFGVGGNKVVIKSGALVTNAVLTTPAFDVFTLGATLVTASGTEMNYLVGVSSAIQTQLDAKQASDSDLTAVAGLSANGLIARTGTGTMSTRTITGTASEVTVSNGDGVAGNPTLSLPTGISATKIAGGGVSSAEFDFLANVTSDIQGQLDLKAPLASPVLTGDPTVPYVVLTDSDQTIANTAFVKSNITAIVGQSGVVHSTDLTVDNTLMRSDGTSGTNAQKSVVLLSDIGALTAVESIAVTNAVTLTTLELGGLGVTDTTLARSGAGQVTIEGNVIYRAGGTDVAVADGGTGLSSGNSGGVLAYTASGTLASSSALTVGGLVVGGGAGAVPSTVTVGATTEILVGGGVGNSPVWTTASGTGAPARVGSPVFTGDPTAPTPAASDNDTSIATTAFVTGSTVTFTGKTFDAAATGNTLKFKKDLKFSFPRKIDGTGCTYPNTNDFTATTFMVPRFSGTAATNANLCRFAIRVPSDIDTAVVATASLTVRLTAADTAAHIYNVGFADVANSAVAAATMGSWIKLDVASDASGASDDIESVSTVTLTGWASGLTAGHWWVIELNRDGATDASTVASDLMELEIVYGVSQ